MGKGMGKGGCSKEGGRIVLWMVWIAVWLISSIYCALAVIMFGKLLQAASEFNYGATQLAKNKLWRAPLTSLALSALLVFGFNFSSCIILIKKSVNRAGAGFSYGFMVAFCIALSFFLLLCGLVLDGFRPEVQQALEPKYDVNGTLTGGAVSWSQYASEGYVGTEVMALLTFVTYFLFGAVLVLLQTAISDHLGIEGAGSGTPALATTNFKAVPAGPPEYDSYPAPDGAAKYGGYVQQDMQQYYDPNAGMYKTVIGGADQGGQHAAYYAAGASGVYGAADYGAATGGDGSPASQNYQVAVGYNGAGYAAVGNYNTYGMEEGVQLAQQAPAGASNPYGQAHQQI